jgi:hypothetical protein
MSPETLEKMVINLSQEVATLRSLVIGVVSERDPEGEYRPEFVKKVLAAMKEQPGIVYQGKGSLLKELKKMR